MKHIVYYSWMMCVFFLVACSGSDQDEAIQGEEKEETQTATEEAEALAESLWATTPLQSQPLSASRTAVFETIQKYADLCSDTYFENYLNSLDQAAENVEKNDVLLHYCRYAFDRVLDGLRNEEVADGTACIWMLYNMGYVVKTPSGSFGVDIMHRWAEKLAPYLDFLCVTHNHQDHYSTELIEAMLEAGKPVLSNYLTNGKQYTSTSATSYSIGNFNIRISITDHNNSGLSNFVSVFCIDCGSDSGNFTLMHTGDSNYKASQFTNILGNVNVLIPRYAPNALTENNIIGTGTGQTTPDYVLLSHILELTHKDIADSRWSLELALERASGINNGNTYVPFWGEKMVWRNGKLY